MTTRQIDPMQDPRWAAFLHSHPRASVFHTPAWLGALHRTYGFQPVVFSTAAPGDALCDGLVFCRVRSWLTGSRYVSLPFSDHCEPLADRPEILDHLLAASQDDLKANHCSYLEIRPITLNSDVTRTWTPAGCYCLHRLDLNPPLESLFRRLHKDCVQRKIVRAEREQLTYEEGRSEQLLDQFYHLTVLTRRRQRLVPQPREWFLNLVSAMGEMLKIRVASKSGRPVAAILTLRYRDTLVYKYGCSDSNFKHLGGMQLVLWRAIQDAKREGLSALDFGRSDWDNQGLIAFKDRWGAQRSQITHLRLPGSRHLQGRQVSAVTAGWKARAAQRVFPHLPDRMLCGVGELIYRHIA